MRGRSLAQTEMRAGKVWLLEELSRPLDVAANLVAQADEPSRDALAQSLTGMLEVEMGMGRGDFLIGYGLANPGVALLGIERSEAIVRRAAEKIGRRGACNVMSVWGDWPTLIREVLPAASCRAVHIYFPDPWPKRSHWRRRTVTAENLTLIKRVLQPGGFVHVRTDVESYFQGMLQAAELAGEYVRIPVPEDIGAHLTGYERKFQTQGLPIYRASFRWVGSDKA